MLTWKMQFLPHISSPSSPIWTIPRQKGVVFLEKLFVYPQPYVMLKNGVLAPYLLSKKFDLKNARQKWVIFSRLTFWVPTCLCYLGKCISPPQVVEYEESWQELHFFQDFLVPGTPVPGPQTLHYQTEKQLIWVIGPLYEEPIRPELTSLNKFDFKNSSLIQLE